MHNLLCPRDFAERGPQLATRKSPTVGHRALVNRGLCGRHTSLKGTGHSEHLATLFLEYIYTRLRVP
jgi:hypothetical protein